MKRSTLPLLFVSLLAVGCVSQERYDLQVKAANDARADAQACRALEQKDRDALAKLDADDRSVRDLLAARDKSAAGRAKNRRIEITLQPNIDELVAVPDVK